MATITMRKPMRLVGALSCVILLYIIFSHVRGASETASTTSFPPELPDLKDTQPLHPPELAQHPTPPETPDPLASMHVELVENAHKLNSADDFQDHFKAVTHIPGITMASAKAGCTWLDPSKVNFQYSEDNDWVTTDRTDHELDMRRFQWHNYLLTETLPYGAHASKFSGRGIIIVAGNEKSLKRVRVILKALTKLKSSLPIELHYWADEMTPDSQAKIAALWPDKMFFNDLSAPTNIIATNHDGPFINYQLKTAAVINSRFAEPLLLDSDNIPLIDPAELYESATYKEFGTLFWPDIARTRPNNPMWGITNTACRMDEYEMESGQMIVDKRRFFYHLQLAAWFNNVHGEYYNDFLLGDKDMFRFTWHALRTRYGAPKKWLTSVGTLSPEPDSFYCGHSFAQHHPDDGRVAFLHGGLIKTMAKDVMRWQRKERGGIFQVYKRSKHDEVHAINVNVSIKWDGARYLPNRPEDLQVASCTDFYEVEPRPLDEIAPGFEKDYEEYGGYWLLDS